MAFTAPSPLPNARTSLAAPLRPNGSTPSRFRPSCSSVHASFNPAHGHSRAQIDTPAPFNFNNTHPPPSMKAKASHPLKKALIAVNPKATPAEVKVAPAIAKKKKKRKNPKAADKRR